jgi:2-octaprenyl-6-methoxyphenol hydroxylase
MQEASRIDCDVLIVGGGLVGSLLANALSALDVDVVLVEARNVHSLAQPSFDGRATALANGTQRVLEQLGLWEAIRAEAQPIRHIHIGEQGRFGAARISARDEGVRALGFTVENRVLGTALWDPLLRDSRFQCLSSAEVVDFVQTGDSTEARIESAATNVVVRARLTVAADGARSGLREALGIGARIDDYEQHAVIVNCTTQEPHRSRAFERFTPNGPLAVLPMTADRVAVVWTLPTSQARAVLDLPVDEFRDALQDAFGFRLGRFERIGKRDSHPLHRVRSNDVIRDRTVLIGNAANSLHPVAGQGFNLAVRDAAALAEVIAAASDDDGIGVGSPALLERYQRLRKVDQRSLTGFTHALVRGFGADVVGLDTLRGLGLMAFDLLPGGKGLLARHTMGLAGRVPRLVRHLDLV